MRFYIFHLVFQYHGFRSHFGGKLSIFSIQGFRLIEYSIDIVLTFEFGHNITISKMAIFNKIDYIDIEPALGFGYWSFRYLGCGLCC